MGAEISRSNRRNRRANNNLQDMEEIRFAAEKTRYNRSKTVQCEKNSRQKPDNLFI